MRALGPKLPLSRDTTFGFYSLITSYSEQIQQNFKNLLLTAPGERMMDPDFGVGLRNYLFEPRQNSITMIRQRISEQIVKYMPFIRNIRMEFDSSADQEYLDNSNMMSLTIIYDVPSLNLSTSLVVRREDLN